MVNIVKDIDLFYCIDRYDVIVLSANIYNTINQGFARDVAINYPYVWDCDLNSKYGDLTKLGTLTECVKEGEPTFVIAYICRGYPRIKEKGQAVDYLSYEHLERCLRLLNIQYKNKKVACPLLGCSRFDGNGNKDKVLEIFNKTITNVNLDVYDFYQKTREEKLKDIYLYEQKIKELDRNAYYALVKKRKEEAEIRFKKNGRVRY